jgi:NADH-quinone oxidoreductase subunit M
MLGELSPKNEMLKDLSARELAVMLPLVALVFWIGLYPRPFLALLEPPAAEIVQRVHSARP